MVEAFPLHALGKFQATYQREGFTQIIKDKFIGKNLGAPSCGHNASIIIVQMSWTMANNLTIEPIKKIIHAYLTGGQRLG
ncbi:Dihydrolipoyl dehydrogenase [Neochlamydia sp. S13]|nr:Dihydrolipoyl dehydrogenase [Neochlamydia sp. S13]